MANSSLKIGELINVRVEKLAVGGNGIARFNRDGQNIVIFIPYSAPEDELEVSITEKHKNYYLADIQKILVPGLSRSLPQCSVFGKCGGCDWQHLSYEEQLKQKQALVFEQITKSGNKDFTFLPILASPRKSHYRNRVQLKFDGTKLGFYARKSHEVVSSESCILMEEALYEKHLQLAKTLKDKNEQAQKIELQLNATKNGDSGFSQVNQFVNEKLITELLNWLAISDFAYFLDLYAGSGNFTFPVLRKFKNVKCIAVEFSEPSVSLARRISGDEKITSSKLKFYLSDVEIFLKRFPIPENSIVLIDPPRTGCSELIVKTLAQSSAQKIFYISCDPACLSRDLQRFVEFGNWRVRRARAFDMFPQTHHIETLLELTR